LFVKIGRLQAFLILFPLLPYWPPSGRADSFGAPDGLLLLHLRGQLVGLILKLRQLVVNALVALARTVDDRLEPVRSIDGSIHLAFAAVYRLRPSFDGVLHLPDPTPLPPPLP